MELISYKITKHEGCLADVQVSLKADDLSKILDKSIKKISKNVNLPGFRKGNVPVSKLLTNFGDKIEEQFKSDIIQESLIDIMKKEDLIMIRDGLKDVVGLDVISINDVKDCEVSLKFEFYPDVYFTLKDITSAIKIKESTSIEVSEKEIDDLELSVRKYFATLDKSDSEIKDEHVIVFDIIDSEGKKSVDAGRMMVKESLLDKGIYSAIQGKSVGFESELMLRVASNGTPLYHKGAKESERKQFTFKVIDVLEMKIPELTEDFAKNQLGADSLEDLRSKMKQQIITKKKNDQSEIIKKSIRDQVCSAFEIDVPESWCNNQLYTIQRQMQERNKEMSEQDISKAKSEIKKNLAFGLALKSIIKSSNIELEDKDYMDYINKMVMSGQLSHNDAAEMLSKGDEWKDRIKDHVLMEKASDLVVCSYYK